MPYGDGSGQFGGRESRVQQGLAGGGRGGNGGAGKMSEKHVWWLVNPSTKQIIAAYFDLRTGMLKEMTLPKCIEVRWLCWVVRARPCFYNVHVSVCLYRDVRTCGSGA